MPEQKPVSFDDIIAEGRRKRKAEELAQKLLGGGRRSSAPAPLGRKKATGAGPLASRVGILRPSATAPKTFGNKTANGSGRNTPRGAGVTAPRASSNSLVERRGRAIEGALNGVGRSGLRSQVNIRGASNDDRGISIRGMGVTYTLIAQNFATGTTASDIESVLAPRKEEDGLIRCRLVASNPTVIAELVFNRKEIVDDIISTYNNKMADGRLLHVWLKDPPPQHPRQRTAYTVHDPIPADNEMDVDEDPELERQQRQLEREEAHAKRTQPPVQDGRYGFSESSEPVSSYQDDYRDSRRDTRSRRHDSEERSKDRYDSRHGRSYGRYDNRDKYDSRGRGTREGGLASDDLFRRRESDRRRNAW